VVFLFGGGVGWGGGWVWFGVCGGLLFLLFVWVWGWVFGLWLFRPVSLIGAVPSRKEV